MYDCDFCGKPLGYYSHADCTPQGEAAREMDEMDEMDAMDEGG
jgi:hypothetical protein